MLSFVFYQSVGSINGIFVCCRWDVIIIAMNPTTYCNADAASSEADDPLMGRRGMTVP